MKFLEIVDAVSLLVVTFGRWDWEQDGKKLKVWYNRDTFDYGCVLIGAGSIRQTVEHADVDLVAQLLIEWLKGENIANYA